MESEQNTLKMEITGKVHLLFEQSGVFKNEFKKLGYEAYDYDIQNNFGETDYQIDLFAEIEKGYANKPSIFDNIGGGDLVMAFFPCIYFCATSQMAFSLGCTNYRKLTPIQAIEKILKRTEDRKNFFSLLIKLFGVAFKKSIRLVVENPYAEQTYLKANFILPPTIVDNNRMLRGDYFVKPTAYWFVNCTNTIGYSIQNDKEKKTIMNTKSSKQAGICSEERSMIHPDYARNFICDFILGKEQQHSQRLLF